MIDQEKVNQIIDNDLKNQEFAKQKLFSEKQVDVSAFLGGPIPPGLLIYRNYKALGKDKEAYIALAATFVFTILFFYALLQIPQEILDKVPNILFTAFYAVLVFIFFRHFMAKDVEAAYGEFTTSVTWSLIVEKIQQGEGFERLEREDLEDSIKQAIKDSFASREEEMTDEMMQQYIDYSMGNQEMLDMHHRRLTNERLYDYLDDKVTKQSDNISATDFVELQKKEQEAA